jgi:hypothetical protein
VTRPTRRRSTWIGAVAGGVIVATVLVLWAGSPLPERTTDGFEIVDGEIHTVEIHLDRGDLTVRGSESDRIEVGHRSAWRGWPPRVSVTVADGIATVVAECPWRPVLGSCATTLDLVVPSDLHIDAHSADGRISLVDLGGWLEIDGHGPVVASGVRSAEVLVTTKGGQVDLGFAAEPSRVDVDSGGGDVRLVVPGGPYEVVADGGSVEVDVAAEELAERMITVDAGRGAITISPPDE